MTPPIFITAGSLNFNVNYSPFDSKFSRDINAIETRIIEVNYDKKVLFEMTFESSGPGSTYRSEKIILGN